MAEHRAEIAGPPVEDLRLALEAALGRPVAVYGRAPFPYRSSYALEELVVSVDDGPPTPMLFKDLSRHTLLPAHRAGKPAFLYDPRREIEVYETVLPRRSLGTAACYAAVADPPRNRFWLFLEKVPGAPLHEIGDLALWQQAARWLAGLHSQFMSASGSVGIAAVAGYSERWVRYDAEFYWRWLRRAVAFTRGASVAPDARRGLEWLAGRYGAVVDRLTALPLTFIHGEFYASNVLIVEPNGADGGSVRVCPVDWEMAARGPGLIDLAALTAGWWTQAEKDQMAQAYHGALAGLTGERAAWEAFQAALDACRLHLAVQWLGWSASWSPPPEQTHDWLAEALRLAERLGL